MKSITLRTLVREPLKVKHWTRRGAKVQVTDNGHPLWVIQAAEETADEQCRRQDVDDVFDQVLREPKSSISLSQIIKESRR
jgi:hypothetical protein